jgi:pimeloyl-ACP methyl ester carboxylesterase
VSRFRYVDSGTGPLVVLMHGFPDLPETWDDVRTRLNAEGFRTVAPYLRGYHPDTLDSRGYGTREQAEDVVQLLDELGADTAVVVGHDWGASCEYAAATLYPERVDRLVTLGIPHPVTLKPSVGAAIAGRHFAWFKLPWAAASARVFGQRMVGRLYRRWSPSWSGPARDAAVAGAVAAFGDRRVLDGALAYYKALNPRDTVLRRRIEVPALVVGGSDEPPVLQHAYEATPGRFTSSCDVVILDGSGHWPHRERADEFTSALLGFLRG